NRAVGVLSVKLQPERPKLQGTLAFETLDLSAYVESARAWKNGTDTRSSVPISLPLLTALDADLRLSANQVLLSGARLGRAAASVTLASGRMTLDLGDAQLYGGHVQGTLRAAIEGEALAASLNGRLRGIPTRVAMSDFFGISSLDGTANGRIEAKVDGRNWAELIDGLDGRAQFTVLNSTLSGVDLRQLRAALLDTDGKPAAPTGETTAFDRIE